MNKFFYAKLAFTNLKKNRSTYVPYIFACVGIVFMYFLLSVMAFNPGLKNIPTGPAIESLFQMGVWTTGLFSVIFILYANSFLIKRRKKEIGLYCILGLEKRHISFVMFYEMLYMAFIGITGGLLLGVIFGKLCFLLLMKFIHVSPDSRFLITGTAVLKCVLFFCILFLVTFVVNYIQVKVTNPIGLLQGEKAGEREPKASVLVLLIGIAGLGGGYYISQMPMSVFASIGYFLIAVICVIIGTYGLFTAGSIFFLKWLKKRKNIYYKPNNFIAISNMLYRMKKNAAGLASICIVSTMLLVVISTTAAMFRGKAQMLRDKNPYDLMIVTNEGVAEKNKLANFIEKKADKEHVRISEALSWEYADVPARMEEGAFEPMYMKGYFGIDDFEVMSDFYVLTLEEYNRITGSQETLKKDEALIFSQVGEYGKQEIKVFGNTFHIKKELGDLKAVGGKKESAVFGCYYLVVKQKETVKALLEEWLKPQDNAAGEGMKHTIRMNLEGLHESKIKVAEGVREYLKNMVGHENKAFTIDSYDINSDDWDGLYGGLMFLGISLSILFLIAMVLIIYFKQVSEGYEDRTRFEVMQKVGMDHREVERAINRQVRLCFILPVAGALLHICFAFKTLNLMLGQLGFADRSILFWCIVLIVLMFCVLYTLVYQITSKVYQRIIEK